MGQKQNLKLGKKSPQIFLQGQILVHIRGAKSETIRRASAPNRFLGLKTQGSNSGLRPRSSAEGLILENFQFSKGGLREGCIDSLIVKGAHLRSGRRLVARRLTYAWCFFDGRLIT